MRNDKLSLYSTWITWGTLFSIFSNFNLSLSLIFYLHVGLKQWNTWNRWNTFAQKLIISILMLFLY